MSKQSAETNRINRIRNKHRQVMRLYGQWSKDGSGVVQTVYDANGVRATAFGGVFHSIQLRGKPTIQFLLAQPAYKDDKKSRRVIARACRAHRLQQVVWS